MQIYNYRCNDCGKTFEVQATLKEKETKPFFCPHCQSESTKSQFSVSNFFKNTFGKSEEKPCCSAESCCGSESKTADKRGVLLKISFKQCFKILPTG